MWIKNIFILIVSIGILPSSTTVSYAYNDIITHPQLVEQAVKSSNIDFYLIETFGDQFPLGTESKIRETKIINLLTNGSRDEDWFICRAANHFHNPTELWDQAYMSDHEIWLDIICTNWKPFYSNVVWATGYLAPPPDGEKITFSPLDPYSPTNWDKARDYFHKALTLTTKEDRDIFLKWSFDAVGHVLHLLQDISVPAHVRNDFTSHFSLREKWTYQRYEHYVKNNPSLVASVHEPVFAKYNNTRLTDFWDAEQYNENNPEITTIRNCSITSAITCNRDSDCPANEKCVSAIGLAEFANANYFSDFTIRDNNPEQEHYFSYPYINGTIQIISAYDFLLFSDDYQICYDYEPNSTDIRKYISRKSKGACPEPSSERNADHFAVPSLIFTNDTGKLEFSLDDNVHNTYAKELLPPAVGYSAGLLDYFFRGELYVIYLVPSNDGVNPIMWGNQTDTGSDINLVSVLIQNNSKIDDVIEPIEEGTLALTISYKDSADTIVYVAADNTVDVTSMPEKGSSSYLNAIFTFTNPIQTQTIEDLTYHLAFKGQLGNEAGAVIGRVIKGPVLHSVYPDEGLEGDEVTLTGNNLPIINGPFPTTSEDVRFQHDMTKLYTTEIVNATTNDITAKVPNTAGLLKPGYGGLRVRHLLDTGEKIYSNPVSIFPIAQGEVKNTGTTNTIDVTITANAPIVGDNNQLPLPPSVNITGLAPGASLPVNLKTGYNYTAAASLTDTQDIEILKPGEPDFIFEVQ